MKAMNVGKMVKAYRKMDFARARWEFARKSEHYSEEEKKKRKEAFDAAVMDLNEMTVPLSLAIREGEGKAKERVIDAHIVARTLMEIEDILDIPKKAMNGIEVEVDPYCQRFPRAYKYTPMSTHFNAVFKSGAWRVTDISRRPCRPSNRVIVKHTPDSEAALIDRFTAF